MTVVTTAVSSLLAIDDDDSWYRNVVAPPGARGAGAIDDATCPGVLFLEIDGLAHDVLRRAMRDGNAPDARALAARAARTGWSAGRPTGPRRPAPARRACCTATTTTCRRSAGGRRTAARAIVTNHPRDAAELERRHSDGRGLLHADGASRANILSGDAPHSMLTMSTVLDARPPGRLGQDYFAYFASPYAVARTLAARRSPRIVSERRARRAAGPRRRAARGSTAARVYALVRAWATVIQRDLQVAAVIGDMLAGRPVVYTTFLAYDEVAHHSGIERPDTLAVLRQVDRQIARIAAAAADAPRPYRLVVLSDHGQSQGATFLRPLRR